MNYQNLLVFTGSYNQDILQGTGQIVPGKGAGISVFCLSPENGEMALLHTLDTPNPSYLVIDRALKHLYAVNELKEYMGQPGSSVSSFAVGEDFSLQQTSIQPTKGTDAAHLQLTADEQLLTVANFRSGSVSVYPVDPDGSIQPMSQFFQHQGHSVDPTRQQGPHAHAVTYSPDGRFAFVPDLGCDCVFVYAIKNHQLFPCPELTLSCQPGAGPRHCIFHPNGQTLYVINELNSTISVYRYHKTDGSSSLVQTVSTLPESHGFSTCSGLKIHPCGRYLYASNRGDDSIAIFPTDAETGMLGAPDWQSTFGRTPRDFSLDPSGSLLIAANQDSDSLAVFRVSPDDGSLSLLKLNEHICTVTCVEIRQMPPHLTQH